MKYEPFGWMEHTFQVERIGAAAFFVREVARNT